MDDKQLTAGLNLLADEFSEHRVDIGTMIDTARVQTRRRRAVTGATLATVAMLAAMSVVLTTMNLGPQTGGAKLSPRTTTSRATPVSGPHRVPVGGSDQVHRVVDTQAHKLTDQLAAAKSSLFPGLGIEPDPARTHHIQGATPPALEFGNLTLSNGSPQAPYYAAFAKLTDQQGFASIQINVYDGAGLARPDLLDCPGGPVCTTRQFPDGTRASWHTNIGDAMGWNQRMAAQRPDGTMILVSISVWDSGSGAPGPSRPQVPLTPDQLYKFATVLHL